MRKRKGTNEENFNGRIRFKMKNFIKTEDKFFEIYGHGSKRKRASFKRV